MSGCCAGLILAQGAKIPYPLSPKNKNIKKKNRSNIINSIKILKMIDINKTFLKRKKINKQIPVIFKICYSDI